MNHKGFTLVEILVATAITSLVGLGIASLISSMMEQKAIVERKAQVADVLSSVGQYLQSATGCSAVMAGQTLPFGPYSVPVPGLAGYSGPGSPVTAGSDLSSTSRVVALTMETDPSESALSTVVNIAAVPYYRRMVNLKLVYTKSEVGAANAAPVIIERLYRIPVLTTAANLFYSCAGQIVQSATELCTSIGGVPASPGCKVGTQCQNFGSFVEKVCNPTDVRECTGYQDTSLYHNPITGGAECPPGTIKIKTGEVLDLPSHVIPGNKKNPPVTVTTNEYFTTCLKCD